MTWQVTGSIPVTDNVKEIFETQDSLTALEMIQNGIWKIISGYRQGDVVTWVLGRVR